MKSLFLSFVLLTLGCFAFAQKTTSSDKETNVPSNIVDRLDESTLTLNQIFAAPDSGIPSTLLSKAQCVILIPNEKKAALGFGGSYGRGFASCRTANNVDRWSAPAPVFLGGGSWGAQIGGESVDVLMLVMDQKGVQKLLSSQFKIGADASAAAGPVGRRAAAGTDWKLNSQILTYSRAKGLFAGIDLNGAVVKQDDDTTKDLYGRMVPFTQILSGQVRTPAEAHKFIAEVHKDFAEARASK